MTAYIPLTDDTFTVVDLEDVPQIFDVSLLWHKRVKGYAGCSRERLANLLQG